VHALGQVVALETDVGIPVDNLVRALNDHLPQAVNVLEGGEVPQAFHPRYSASGKLYSYRILNRPAGSPFITRYAWHVPAPVLDVERMRAAAELVKGKHDFAAFQSAGSCAQSTVRRLYRFDLERHGDVVETYLEADGFLYRMVRNLVGTMVEVGAGRRGPEEVTALLESRDRTLVGAPAPPQGLCLVRVFY
jgi:tRNA pseudouridine38-40 synthase